MDRNATATAPRFATERRTDKCDCCEETKAGTTHFECEAPIFHQCDGCNPSK